MTLLTDGSLGRLRELLAQTDGMEEREGTDCSNKMLPRFCMFPTDILKSVSAHYTMTCRHLGELLFSNFRTTVYCYVQDVEMQISLVSWSR